MRKIIFPFVLLIAMLLPVFSQNMSDYCAVPPYISTSITPNVLLIFDNSGSMMNLAYPAQFERDRSYYGYFDPTKRYSYSSQAGGYFYEDANGAWSGNWLNWATMRRVDIAKKVMVGGLCINRANPNSVKYLQGQPNPDRDFYRGWFNDNVSPYNTPYHGNYYYGNRYGNLYVDDDTSPFSSPIATYTIKVHIGTQEPLGVIQKTASKVRWGLMFFNRGPYFEDGSGRDGAYLQNDVGDLNTSIVTNIENITPDTWTPSAEALYEAVRVFMAGKTAYNGGVNYAPKDPIQYYCQKNFIIFVTDGNPTKDKNIPGGYWGSPNPNPPGNSPEGAPLPDINIQTFMQMINSNEGGSPYCRSAYDQVTSDCGYDPSDGTFYLEGVSYWAHITDLRPDVSSYPKSKGKQNLHIYTVFAFAQQESIILKLAAKYGGFDDLNGNLRPDIQTEWDKNGDGDPDNYFQASSGYGLERALIAAINDILKRTASGTSASVLSTSTRGAVSMLQAFFTPRYVTVDKDLTWVGHLQYLWLDTKFNIREDTVKDDKLILNQDKIIQPFIDLQSNDIKVRYFVDGNGDGRADFPCEPEGIDSFENIKSIWRAESVLLFQNPSNRNIFTFVDTNKNGRPDSGEVVDFTTYQSSRLAPFFRVSSSEAENYIRYIRGEDLDICLDPPTCSLKGHRDRTIAQNVWKLGDIVHSTPRVVGNNPINSYHLDYLDTTYQEFVKSSDPNNPTLYESRKNVIYVGANDGMLHCINMGKLVEDRDPNNPQLKAHLEGVGRGAELWAYIPYNLIAHLPWFGYPDYCHVYYVDGRTLVVDASVNGPSGGTKTKDSWRTILIGTMRFGGKPITIQGNFGLGNETRTFSSAIFAIDVTDPENPSLLWEFTDPDLGFTTSFPGVVRFGDKSVNGDWYVVFGNGPKDFTGRNQTVSPKLYVVNLRTGELLRKIELIGTNVNGYVGDLVAIDPDKDYNVDTIYAGTVEVKNNVNKPLEGRLLRIQTMESSNPNSWVVSTLVNPTLPITAAPEVVFDERRNIWVLFGTGIFLSIEDKAITYPQSLFGVRDNYWNGYSGTGTVNLNDLFTMDLSDNSSANDYDVTAEVEDFTCVCNGIEVPEMIIRDPVTNKKTGCALPSEKVVTYVKDAKVGTTNWKEHLNTVTTQYKGWRLIIPSGERCITKPFVMAGLADFLVYIPTTDPCTMGGETKMYTLFYQTGTAFLQPIYLTPSAVSGSKIKRAISLGPGAPPPGEGVTAAITKEGNIEKFVQVSTGVVIQSLQQPPYNIKSRIIQWMEK
ncbi:MAG: pilus assembly protein [Candidatus Aminicenantia bacterium]